MTETRLAAIRDRLNAATPGPWDPRLDIADDWRIETAEHAVDVAFIGSNDEPGREADAEFIAASRMDVWWPLERLAEVTVTMDRVREIHKPIGAVMYDAGGRQHPRQVCTGCGTDDGNWQIWPCPTIRAIKLPREDGPR